MYAYNFFVSVTGGSTGASASSVDAAAPRRAAAAAGAGKLNMVAVSLQPRPEIMCPQVYSPAR